MMERPLLRNVGRLGAICALVVLAPAAAVHATEQGIVWDMIERGILYTRIPVDDLGEGGGSWVHVFNIDASRFGLRLFRFQDYPANRPLSFDEWYAETDTPVLFNVCPGEGQGGPRGFYRVSGTTLEEGMRDAWKGLLAMGPADGTSPDTTIIDLEFNAFDARDPRYEDVIQQPMLLDEEENLRVSPREVHATRVALAEDESHNLMVILTEKPCTLYAFARWLRDGPFALKRAMNLGEGNAPQVLGRFAPDRVYVLPGDSNGAAGGTSGWAHLDLSSSVHLDCVLGVESLPR